MNSLSNALKSIGLVAAAAAIGALCGCGYRGPTGGYYFEPSGQPLPEAATCTIVSSLTDARLSSEVSRVLASALQSKGVGVVSAEAGGSPALLSVRLSDTPLADPRMPFVDRDKSLSPDRCVHAVLTNADGVELWSAHFYGARYDDALWQSFVTRHLAEGVKEI